MTEAKQPKAVFGCTKFLLHMGGQWGGVAKERVPIEAMMNTYNIPSSPLAQLLGKGRAGRHCEIRPVDRALRKDAFDTSVEPETVIPASSKVAKEICRSIESISRKQNLRHRRSAQNEV